MKWIDMTLAEFQLALASSEPTPGGGTAAAIALGQATSLTMMVTSLTILNTKWADGHEAAHKAEEVCNELYLRTGDLAQLDSEAFEQVMKSFQMPKTTEDEIKIWEMYQIELFVGFMCFIAGMPFLGDLDDNMRVKRLETPRVKVPKGSIGVTEQFANIYTFESPGGWNIIGNTPLKIFNSSKETEPNLINPGDTVIFKKISLENYNNFDE